MKKELLQTIEKIGVFTENFDKKEREQISVDAAVCLLENK